MVVGRDERRESDPSEPGSSRAESHRSLQLHEQTDVCSPIKGRRYEHLSVTAAAFGVLFVVTTTVAALPIDSGDYYEGIDRNSAADKAATHSFGYSGSILRVVGPTHVMNRSLTDSGATTREWCVQTERPSTQ